MSTSPVAAALTPSTPVPSSPRGQIEELSERVDTLTRAVEFLLRGSPDRDYLRMLHITKRSPFQAELDAFKSGALLDAASRGETKIVEHLQELWMPNETTATEALERAAIAPEDELTLLGRKYLPGSSDQHRDTILSIYSGFARRIPLEAALRIADDPRVPPQRAQLIQRLWDSKS